MKMESCECCKEKWFHMTLSTMRVCKACRIQDGKAKRRDDEPFLYSAENNMDPGDIPEHLATLTPMEEMIIARAHVYMQIKRQRGLQYSYAGHCVTFTVKLFSELPRLPHVVDIVLRPPERLAGQAQYTRQFRAEFRVRVT